MNLSVNGGLVRSNLSWSLSGARDLDRREESSSLGATHRFLVRNSECVLFSWHLICSL